MFLLLGRHALNNLDFVLRQPVQRIHQPVDLLIRRGDPTLLQPGHAHKIIVSEMPAARLSALDTVLPVQRCRQRSDP